ncbi:MAG TPA: M14 family zinc carboxypeptidase, partial [Terriglobia bacterium]|nr:M14 family zinc carboxypeptidase [Terriglobia bacterium]
MTLLSQIQTRAERTNYAETSRYDDVVAFLDTVAKQSPLIHNTTFGNTFEGRALPLAVVGKVGDATSRTVRASGKLRVYIQANIHAGEVEGKESSLALIREIASGKHAEWLNSMVLLIAPIYNADGNERVGPNNRGPQNGPIAGAGIRANAQGLNLNRDNMKLDTPEARSMAKLLNDYDPHVMIDLHTTNGSHHAYHLTWEIPNNTAVDAGIT